MSHCILSFSKSWTAAPHADQYVVYWDAPAQATELSLCYNLPELMGHKFLEIRAAHAAFAADLGTYEILGRPLAEHLQVQGHPSMWYCSLLYERHPKMTPNLYLIYKLRTLEYFLDEHNCTKLAIIGQPKSQSQEIYTCLKDLCQKTKREFQGELKEQRSCADGSFVKRLYHNFHPKLRVVLRFIHWYVTIKRKFKKVNLEQASLPTASIVTYFPNIDLAAAANGRFISRYFEKLHTLLNSQAKALGRHFVRWLFIRFPAPQLSLDACIKLCHTFADKACDGRSFNYLEEFLDAKDLYQTAKNYLSIAQKSKQLAPQIQKEFCFKNSKLNFWPLAEADYVESFQGWRCFERCFQSIALRNYVSSVPKQLWFLYPLENCPWERMLCYHVHQQSKGQTIGAQHSSLRPTDLRYFDAETVLDYHNLALPKPDLVVVNGSSAYAQLVQANFPKEHLRIASALRYLYLANCQRLAQPKPIDTLLVLTSFFADETKEHIELFLQAYNAKLFENLTIIFKPHPYLPITSYLPAKHNFKLGQEPLQTYFKQGVLVWAANSTTAALEAAIIGLPLAVMQASSDFDLCPIQDLPDLIRTKTLDDVRRMLKLQTGPSLPANYLCLDTELETWKKILNISN